MSQTLTPELLAAIIKYKVPPAPARAGYIVDVIALANACRQLHVDWPILFRWSTAQYKRGHHRGGIVANQHYHQILLEQNRPIDSANRTLWHELAHAAQAEAFVRAGHTLKDFDNTYNAYGRTGQAYKTNPFEVDANQVAKDNEHIWLVKLKTQNSQ